MSYKITDLYHELVINLTTNITNTNNIKLQVFKSTNTTSTPDITITPTKQDNKLKFTIKNNQFKIGDVLNKFKVISNNTTLQNLNEGISIFVDGVETDIVNTSSSNPKWTHTFDDEQKIHTVQAVFKGNSALKPYFDTVKTIHVKQKDTGDDGSGLTGEWKIICLTDITTITYGDNKEMVFQLLRGGNPAPKNKVIEISYPDGRVSSEKTDNSGKVSFNLGQFDAGTYNIAARFYDYTVTDGNILTSCVKKVTINKATPKITFNPSTKTSDGHARFYVRGVNKTPLGKYKCSVWVNSKKKTTKLSANGNIGFNLKKKGTYKLKVSVNATKNYKAASLTKTETKK